MRGTRSTPCAGQGRRGAADTRTRGSHTHTRGLHTHTRGLARHLPRRGHRQRRAQPSRAAPSPEEAGGLRLRHAGSCSPQPGGWGGAWPGSPLPSTHPPGPPKEPPCILQGCPLRDARTGWCFPNHESWRWAGRGGDDNAAFTARRGVRPGEMFSALPDLQRNLRKIPGSPPAVTRFPWQA